MALDLLPYLVASDAANTGQTTLVLTGGDNSGWPVCPGDAVIVAGGSGNAQPTGVTDSQGHLYTKIIGTGVAPVQSVWRATATNGLKAPGPGVTPDTITVTYSATTQAKQWIIMGCQGVTVPEDAAVTALATGTSTAPSVTSGTPTAAGELMVAVVLHQNAGGNFTFGSGWQPVAMNVTVGANSLCSMATRVNAGTAQVTASGTLSGSSTGWSVSIIGLKMSAAWLAIGKSYVGASVFSGAYPGLGYTNYQAKTAFDGFVGRVSANLACKRYLNEAQFESAANPYQSVVDYMTNHNIFCVVCVKPTRAVSGGIAADVTNLRTMLTYWKNNGIAPHVCMGNESNINGSNGPFGTGTQKDWDLPSPYGTSVTGAQAAQNYINWFTYYGPTILSSGLQCQYNPAISSSTSALSFIPPRLQSTGAPLCTGISIDYYYQGDYGTNGITLTSILNACNTASPPMPAGIGEMGGTDGTQRPIQTDPAGTASWIDNQVRIPFQNQLTVGARANLPVMWYANGTGNTIDGTTDPQVVSAYQRLYDGLSSTATSFNISLNDAAGAVDSSAVFNVPVRDVAAASESLGVSHPNVAPLAELTAAVEALAVTNVITTVADNWVWQPGMLYTPADLMTYAQTRSNVFNSATMVRGLQFATVQSDPVQLIGDPEFLDPNLTEWANVGDALELDVTTEVNAALGNMVQVNRLPSANSWAMLQAAYPTWNAISSTWSQLQGIAQGQTYGGIEYDGPVLQATAAGRVYAAARVFSPVPLDSPLLLQLMDASTGMVLAEADQEVAGGVVTEWWVGYTIGAGGSPSSLTWAQVQTTYPTWNATVGQTWQYIDTSFAPLGAQLTVRVIQQGLTENTWYQDNISVFEDAIIWQFSNDGGQTWYPAYDIRNNPNGVFIFPPPSNGIGNQLTWQVFGYRPGLHITSLVIRPWYGVSPFASLPRSIGVGHGPNSTPTDHYSPIEVDARFKMWDSPIPMDWWFAYRQMLLAGVSYDPIIQPPAEQVVAVTLADTFVQPPVITVPPVRYADLYSPTYQAQYGVPAT